MLVALIGNQNCGKTTLYNRLTGGRRKTGNFPGVTVDAASAKLLGSADIEIADLPGIYSLSPCSEEEELTRAFLDKEKPDLIINILDAGNLNRNLYLTLQLLETQIPVFVVLNMMDEVQKNGGKIDTEKMSELLGAEVFSVSASKNIGIDKLINAVKVFDKSLGRPSFPTLYAGVLFESAFMLSRLIADKAKALGIPPLYAAVKYFENDPYIPFDLIFDKEAKLKADAIASSAEKALGTDQEAAVADMRYDAVEKLCRLTVIKSGVDKNRLRTNKIDRILTNKYLAVPIFLAVMALIFYLTFGPVGKGLGDKAAGLVSLMTNGVRVYLTRQGVSVWLISFVSDGVLAGIGSVLSFLPMIITLFFFLSIVEDTGYMARVAFIMDSLLKKIGLSGRSIVPALIGFGCSVPSYMSLRTLSTERDKRLTALLVPFMPCSAKIPIFALFTAAFFKDFPALIMLLIYVLSIVIGVIYALILKNTSFKGELPPFVMELPPYRLPSPKTVLVFLWDKVRGFLNKAFTVILLTSVIVWFLRSFTPGFTYTENGSDSILANAARSVSFIFTPLGFNDWRAVSALISGLAAKEAVVSTLSILYGAGQGGFISVLSSVFTPLQALSFVVFSALYMPCTAALAAFVKEMKSAYFAFSAMALQTLIAYFSAFFVYTSGLVILSVS